MTSYPRDIHLWRIAANRESLVGSDGIGGSSGDETRGSETALRHRLLKPAERNEAGWGKSSRCRGSGIVTSRRDANERLHTPGAVIPEVGTQNAGG